MAALAGLTLDPWQAHVLEVGLGEADDGHWSSRDVCLIVARQNGKNVVLHALELFALFVLGEPVILHTAHEFKAARKAFREIMSLIQHTPSLMARVDGFPRNPSEMGVRLKTGEELLFIARSSGSGRAKTAQRLIFDEAFNLTDDHLGALLPTLKTAANPQVWYTSSAAWATSERLHQMRQRALGDAPGRLAYLEWSAAEDCDETDRRNWAIANPGLGLRVFEESMEEDLASMSRDMFRREDLSIPDAPLGAGVIPLALWHARAVDDNVRPTGPRFALDVTPERSAAAICVAGKRPDGVLQVEVAEHRDGVDWVVPEMVRLSREWGVREVVVDGSSAAASLVADLEQADLTVVTSKPRDLMVACGQFYDAVVNAGLLQVPDAAMTAAIAGATKRPMADAWVWNRRNTGFDISPLVATTLALWSAMSIEEPAGFALVIS